MLKKIFFKFALYSGLNFLYEFFSDNKIFIIGYHSVSFRSSKVSMRPDLFERQIKFLVDHNHNFIHFSDLSDLKIKNIKKPTIIYFDDGFKDNLLNALPILKKYNITATVFIVPKFVDSESGEYMDWNEIREMYKEGIEIGSHTFSHAMLNEIDTENLKNEVVSSKLKIEKVLSSSVESFSYPKGRVNDGVIKMVKEAGYKFAITTKYGVNSIGYISKNPFLLKKIAPRVYESFSDFQVRLYSYNIFR